MALRTEQGVVILTGCAHRGLLNSISAAREAAGETRVRAILGGAHLRKATLGELDRAVDEAACLEPEFVALGHCTDEEAAGRFGEALGERFEPLRAGDVCVADRCGLTRRGAGGNIGVSRPWEPVS